MDNTVWKDLICNTVCFKCCKTGLFTSHFFLVCHFQLPTKMVGFGKGQFFVHSFIVWCSYPYFGILHGIIGFWHWGVTNVMCSKPHIEQHNSWTCFKFTEWNADISVTTKNIGFGAGLVKMRFMFCHIYCSWRYLL